MDKTLRQFERQQNSLQYKLLRRRLGFGEVLPTESSPKIFKATDLLINISKQSWGHGSGSGYGKGHGHGYGSGVESGDGYGWGFGYGFGAKIGSGYGSGSGVGSGYGSGRR